MVFPPNDVRLRIILCTPEPVARHKRGKPTTNRTTRRGKLRSRPHSGDGYVLRLVSGGLRHRTHKISHHLERISRRRSSVPPALLLYQRSALRRTGITGRWWEMEDGGRMTGPQFRPTVGGRRCCKASRQEAKNRRFPALAANR